MIHLTYPNPLYLLLRNATCFGTAEASCGRAGIAARMKRRFGAQVLLATDVAPGRGMTEEDDASAVAATVARVNVLKPRGEKQSA
jgi:hypothetical protein